METLTQWTFKDFEGEFRLMLGVDNWATALDAWFEAVGQMNKRSLFIPDEWLFTAPMGGDGTDEDSYFNSCFESMDNDTLVYSANFLARYCHLLEKNGHSY